MVFSSALIAGFAALLVLLPRSYAVDLPAPAPHGLSNVVAHHRAAIVDTSRKDPYSPDEDRKVAFSLFLPVNSNACTTQCSNPYMPDQTAKVSDLQFFDDGEADVFEQITFQSCCASSAEVDNSKLPTIVFEPAAGVSRLVYTQLARQVSAVGSAVVLIDHAHDAVIVEYEDGTDKSAVENNGSVPLDPFQVSRPLNDTVTKAIETRIADIKFVLSQINSTDVLEQYFPDIDFKAPLDTENIGIIGHGLGGTVATAWAAEDDRVDLSINLVGTAPVLDTDVKANVVFFGRDGYTRNDDPDWQDALQHLTRFTEWTYTKAAQMDYTDLPLIVDLVKPTQTAKGLGGNGGEAFRAIACFLEAYVRTWVDPGARSEISQCFNFFRGMQPFSS